MAESRIIPTQAATDLPTLTVLVDGEDIGETFGIVAIMTTKSVNRIPKARLVLGDGDVSKGDFEISSGDLFVPGKEIEIKAGYHHIEDTIFKGIIIRHSIRARENRNPVLMVEMRDKAVKMTIGRRNRYFEEVTDGEIMEELIGAYDLEADVEATDGTHDEMVQHYTTDWDFMISRAEVNSRLVYTDDGKISVKKPDLDQEPLLNLAYGHNIIEFEAGMDARDQYASTNSKSWDYTTQEILEEEGDDPELKEQGNFTADELAGITSPDPYLQQHSGKVPNAELKAWSDAKMLKSRLAKVKGRVKIMGFSDIKPGHVINLEEFGDRFNGPAFVSSVIHNKSADSDWYTDIEFGLDQEWFINRYEDIVARQASGLLPPIHGLQVGIVTNIHEDPDGDNRIKVRLPMIDPEHEGVWARIVSPDAGNGHGITFRPEVEDEVITGFVNDDPRDPVILGMVHSRGKPSPLPAEEENNEKGIVTRSKLKLLFDDEKKSVTVETPGGNKWVLSDEEGIVSMEDENGNKVKMSSGGISIESAGDITLKATGDVNVEGTNINNEATAGYKAEGGAGAELSSNAQTVVKGSLVTIN